MANKKPATPTEELPALDTVVFEVPQELEPEQTAPNLEQLAAVVYADSTLAVLLKTELEALVNQSKTYSPNFAGQVAAFVEKLAVVQKSFVSIQQLTDELKTTRATTLEWVQKVTLELQKQGSYRNPWDSDKSDVYKKFSALEFDLGGCQTSLTMLGEKIDALAGKEPPKPTEAKEVDLSGILKRLETLEAPKAEAPKLEKDDGYWLRDANEKLREENAKLSEMFTALRGEIGDLKKLLQKEGGE
jgi:hypothetical protein